MALELTVLFILGLAAWRLSSLLVNERGPWDLFVRIRKLAGIVHDDKCAPVMIPDNVLAGILSCVWCCSIWVAAGLFLFWLVTPLLATKIATVFAISAVAIVVDKWVEN